MDSLPGTLTFQSTHPRRLQNQQHQSEYQVVALLSKHSSRSVRVVAKMLHQRQTLLLVWNDSNIFIQERDPKVARYMNV
jgi:hypothetical protein